MKCVAHRPHMSGSNWNSSFPSSRSARPPVCLSFEYNLQCSLLVPNLFPPHHRMFQWLQPLPYLNLPHIQTSDISNSKRTWCALGLFGFTFSPSNHPRPDHAPIVSVIQSEHLKYSISPRNQSAKHPDSGCFGISGVAIGSVLSQGWRYGPEALRAADHFLRLDRNWNRKPRMKSLSHRG